MDTISLIGSLLYQWDTDRKVKIIPPNSISVDEVHFTNDLQDALVVEPKSADNVLYADIPNILLQEKRNIKVYVVMHTENGERTVCSRGLTVNSRQKPADYIYTETEVKSYEKLDQRIKALEETAVLTAPQNLTDNEKVQTRANIDAIGAPQTAEVGQFIKVTEVDENGKPIAWEAGDPDWERMENKPFCEMESIEYIISPTEMTFTVTANDSGETYANSVEMDGTVWLDKFTVGDVLTVIIDGKEYVCTVEAFKSFRRIYVRDDDGNSLYLIDLPVTGLKNENFNIYLEYFTEVGTYTINLSMSRAFTKLKKIEEKFIPDLPATVPNILTANVGQMILVKAVDENNVPTEWECVDMVSGGNEWKKIATIELTEAVSTIDITHDVNGTPLEELGYNEIVGMAVIEGVEGNSALWAKMGIVYRMHQNPTMNDITEKTAISSVSGGMISSGRKRLNFIIKVIGNRVFFTDNDINTLKSNDTGWLEYFIGSNQYMNLLSIKFCGHVATDVFGIGSEFEVWGR